MLNIGATDECLNTFNNMKLKHKIAGLVFYVTKKDNKKKQVIEIEKQLDKEECGDDARDAFIAAIKESGMLVLNLFAQIRIFIFCVILSLGTTRYGVIDHNNKLLFVSWVPDTAKPKDKMVYASIKEAFIESLVGVQIKTQCTDDSELSKEAIAELTKSNV